MEDSSSLNVRVREVPGWVESRVKSFGDQGKTAVRTLSAVGQVRTDRSHLGGHTRGPA